MQSEQKTDFQKLNDIFLNKLIKTEQSFALYLNKLKR